MDALSTEFDHKAEAPALAAPLETLRRLPWYEQEYHHREFDERSIYSESISAAYLLGGFDFYTSIRLLAENPSNLKSLVRWDFGYLCQSGWAHEDEFKSGLKDRDTFLIVTEGSSDAAMIRHAISLLKPECADFFRYVDMEKGYPFSGTGELHRFIQGFIALRVPLKVVAIYDNDAEGFAGYTKTAALKLPSTYRVLCLPDLPELQAFPALGPGGEPSCDINRRAASLECYLDLSRKGLPPVTIEWGGTNKTVDLQQGALKGKGQFMKDFLSYRGKPDRRGSYDLSRLEPVIDTIFQACISISEDASKVGIRARKR